MSSDESLGGVGLPPPPPTWENSSAAPPLVGLPAETGKLTPVDAIVEDEEPVDELWADAKLEPMEIGESEKMWTQPSTESVVGPAPIAEEVAAPRLAPQPRPAAAARFVSAPPIVPDFPDAPAANSKLPMILGGLGLLAGVVALVVVVTRDKSPDDAAADKQAQATASETERSVAPPAPSQLPPPPARVDDDLAGRARRSIEDGEFEAGMKLANELLEQDPEGNAEAFIELACLAEDGVEARKIFRPLQGPKARARLADECETRGVDLYFKGDGASATEYFRQAERAFEDKRWSDAYKLARSSSRVESSAKAIRIMALASCHKDDTAEAKRLLKMLLPKEQGEVEEACGGSL